MAVKGLVHEWQTKFGTYRLFDQGDQKGTFALDRYAVKKKGPGAKTWRTLDLGLLTLVEAQSICAGFAALAKKG